MNVLFNETFALSWEIALGVSSKFLRDLMGNNYCKKEYSKGEVSVVEITQIRLQKMKKNVAMASFYFIKSSILCYKKGKKRLVCVAF